MYKFYIIDDDISVVKVLENIIEDEELGQVIGTSIHSEEGLINIKKFKPDIVLIDLLMPKKDGIQIVSEMKNNGSKIRFIMISQVNSKDMISKAYKSKIEFFINKPINLTEVISVVKKVIEKIEIEEKLEKIKNMFDVTDTKKEKNIKVDYISDIKISLNSLGILGEKGGEDILDICLYLINNNKSVFDFKIRDICKKLNKNPSAMEQRVRRAINKGLVNLANLGIEDYMNSNFIRYSNSLFNFEDVKSEMDFIRGNKKCGGKINVKKFIDSIILHSQTK